MSPSKKTSTKRQTTPLSHELRGQITDIENGGWNASADVFSPIKSYSKLKNAASKERRGRGMQNRIACIYVLDALTAAVETGSLTHKNCYTEFFVQKRDWRRLIDDLGRCKYLWMNERHYYALAVVMDEPPGVTYLDVAANLFEAVSRKPGPDESLAVSEEDHERLLAYSLAAGRER